MIHLNTILSIFFFLKVNILYIFILFYLNIIFVIFYTVLIYFVYHFNNQSNFKIIVMRPHIIYKLYYFRFNLNQVFNNHIQKFIYYYRRRHRFASHHHNCLLIIIISNYFFIRYLQSKWIKIEVVALFIINFIKILKWLCLLF